MREALSHGGHPYLAVCDRQYSESIAPGERAPRSTPCAEPGSGSSTCTSATSSIATGWAAPIHGDYDHSNVLVHAHDRSRVRVVDWEWAGIGVPHADLACLLKRASPDDERAALAIFACGYSRLTAEEHLRLFRWCQLERRLLDAGFIARQQAMSTRPLPRLDAFVRDAAGDVLRTLGLLEAAPRRLAVA